MNNPSAEKLVGRRIDAHADDCYALAAVRKGEWSTPWYFDGQIVYRKRNGHKGGHVRFLLAKCNCTGCPAEMLIREDALLEQIPHE